MALEVDGKWVSLGRKFCNQACAVGKHHLVCICSPNLSKWASTWRWASDEDVNPGSIHREAGGPLEMLVPDHLVCAAMEDGTWSFSEKLDCCYWSHHCGGDVRKTLFLEGLLAVQSQREPRTGVNSRTVTYVQQNSRVTQAGLQSSFPDCYVSY